MAKSKRTSKDSSKGGHGKKQNKSRNANDVPSPTDTHTRYVKIYPLDWRTVVEYAFNMIALMSIALSLGYCVGIGWINITSKEWRLQVAQGIRLTKTYQVLSVPDKWPELSVQSMKDAAAWLLQYDDRTAQIRDLARNPSHPMAFAILREAIIREKGGFVHDDLGLMEPAPSGAARGLGMVRHGYYQCQSRCFPGTWQEKQANRTTHPTTSTADQEPMYKQEEVLIKVPLSFQMTRQLALDTLSTLVPVQVQTSAGMHTLDDAALLVLLLAHERGVGILSRWLPYIMTLPLQPSCGYARSIRPQILDMVEMLRVEYNVETTGWATELIKASQYATRIIESLSRDYGAYIRHPPGVSAVENLEWALCHVASRATAGQEKYGALRLVPLMDMINHDASAGGFVELSGRESFANKDFVEATQDDAGAFVVRSLRNGRRRPLKKGQELMVNYNVPQYSPLDWIVSTGFLPPERWGRFQKADRVWPPQRWSSVPEGVLSTEEHWKKDAPKILQSIREADMRTD